MTTQKYRCEPIKLDYFTQAPFAFVTKTTVNATPEEIWPILEDAKSWSTWASVIQKVTWTSPKPFGLGTTRTVEMSGGMVGDETFIGWEPNKRMSFCFTSASIKGVNRFGEDWQLLPQANGQTLVQWTMALDVALINRIFLMAFKPVMKLFLQRLLNSFQKYVNEGQFAASQLNARNS